METELLLEMRILILIIYQTFIFGEHVITIQINGRGIKSFFDSSYYKNQKPDEIYINGIKQTNIENKFNSTRNYNVTFLWNNNIDNCCSKLFQYCSYIKEIDLSRLNNSGNEIMNNMFSGCSDLISLNLVNVETFQVKNMENMFQGCRSLTTLDLGNFETSQVTNMEYMFSGCSSLSVLELNTNFKTQEVTNMSHMFSGCKNLSSIKFGSPNTEKVKSMKYMFSGCSALNNFDIHYLSIKQ